MDSGRHIPQENQKYGHQQYVTQRRITSSENGFTNDRIINDSVPVHPETFVTNSSSSYQPMSVNAQSSHVGKTLTLVPVSSCKVVPMNLNQGLYATRVSYNRPTSITPGIQSENSVIFKQSPNQTFRTISMSSRSDSGVSHHVLNQARPLVTSRFKPQLTPYMGNSASTIFRPQPSPTILPPNGTMFSTQRPDLNLTKVSKSEDLVGNLVSQRFSYALANHRKKIFKPICQKPFCSQTDLVSQLLPYHLTHIADPTLEYSLSEHSELISRLTNVSRRLAKCKERFRLLQMNHLRPLEDSDQSAIISIFLDRLFVENFKQPSNSQSSAKSSVVGVETGASISSGDFHLSDKKSIDYDYKTFSHRQSK